MWIAFSIAYGLLSIWVARKVAWKVYDSESRCGDSHVDGEALCMGIASGLFAGIFAPITAFVLLAGFLFHRIPFMMLRLFTSPDKASLGIIRTYQITERHRE